MRHFVSWILAALLALAVPLASRPHEAPSRVELLLAALALPDGTLPVICEAGDEDRPPGGHEARCALCVLAKLAVLGPAPAVPGRVLTSNRTAAPLAPRLAGAAAWLQAPPARGPPLPLIA